MASDEALSRASNWAAEQCPHTEEDRDRNECLRCLADLLARDEVRAELERLRRAREGSDAADVVIAATIRRLESERDEAREALEWALPIAEASLAEHIDPETNPHYMRARRALGRES